MMKAHYPTLSIVELIRRHRDVKLLVEVETGVRLRPTNPVVLNLSLQRCAARSLRSGSDRAYRFDRKSLGRHVGQ
jgi:hypothetical protein